MEESEALLSKSPQSKIISTGGSSSIQFPDYFFFGTSTASGQIETASNHQWKGVRSKDGHIFNRTTDHEKRRTEDLKYITMFGEVYRCSVDWARLQSGPNAEFSMEVVAEYQKWFKNLKNSHMKIMFVLHHFTNPLWFEKTGGWTNSDNVPRFLNYVEQCIKYFGEFVSYWNTFNEPGVYTANGYILGVFPPFLKFRMLKAERVLRNMGAAHHKAYALIKQSDQNAMIGISKCTCIFEGRNFLGKIFAKIVDWYFMDHVSSFFAGSMDFWGLSYYTYMPFTPFPVNEVDRPGELDRMGVKHDKMWGLKPEGLKINILRFAKKYKKPVIITENGICTDNDEERIQYIKLYLKNCYEAIQEGADLRGYIFWSTWDNFEWNLGVTYRFGLLRVNFETMDRIMTPAAEYYSKVCKEKKVDLL
jgi:beta-glucosidase